MHRTKSTIDYRIKYIIINLEYLAFIYYIFLKFIFYFFNSYHIIRILIN